MDCTRHDLLKKFGRPAPAAHLWGGPCLAWHGTARAVPDTAHGSVKLILVPSSKTGLPKATKLRCSLCDTIFSSSNPSCTASEHLKHNTCPNFTSPTTAASTVAALPSSLHKPITSPCSFVGHHLPPLHHHHQLVLSDRKEDLGALAMLEDSVKKLKSPKASPMLTLTKAQIESAVSLLSD